MGRFERDTAEYDRCLQIEVGECAELADIFENMEYKEKMGWVRAIRGYHGGR